VISDRKPLSFSVKCSVLAASNMHSTSNNSDLSMPMWNTCDHSTLACYTDYLDKLLQKVHVPLGALHNTAILAVLLLVSSITIYLIVFPRLLLTAFPQDGTLLVILMYLGGTRMSAKNMKQLGKLICVGLMSVNQNSAFTLIL